MLLKYDKVRLRLKNQRFLNSDVLKLAIKAY